MRVRCGRCILVWRLRRTWHCDVCAYSPEANYWHRHAIRKRDSLGHIERINTQGK